jgi:O-antigen/teichoic acid export membrane protein
VAGREFSGSSFIIRDHDLPKSRLAGVCTFVIGVNGLITLAIALSAPLFGFIYADERLIPYLRVMSMGLMIEAFVIPVVFNFRRQMQFYKSAIIGLTGTFALVVATIGLAWLGSGAMSAAWGFLIGMLASAIVCICLCPNFWFFRPCVESWASIAEFATYNGTSAILRQAYESLPYLLLGHVMSFDAVAYYHRALMLSQLPAKVLLQGVEIALLPAIAEKCRRSEDFHYLFFKTIKCVSSVYWPIVGLLAVLADPVVRVLYGDKWGPAAGLLQIMAIAALAGFMGKLDMSVQIALGRVQDLVKRNLIAFASCGVITSTAAFFGLKPLAYSYLLTQPIQLILSIYFLSRCMRVTWFEFGSALSNSALATIVTLLGPLILVCVLAGLNIVAVLIAGSIVAFATWVTTLWIQRHPLLLEVARVRRGFVS